MSSSDRTLKHFRLDPRKLGEIVEIMTRNGRGVVVKIDDQKVDNPKNATYATLLAAKDVDIKSFWVNPDRTHWGRRHFVYFLAGPQEAQYFGDSTSPEVTEVVEALDAYFDRKVAAVPSGRSVPTAAGWQPQGWLFQTWERFVAGLCLAGVVIAIVAFILGRWSVDDGPVYTTPVSTDTNLPTNGTVNPPIDAVPTTGEQPRTP